MSWGHWGSDSQSKHTFCIVDLPGPTLKKKMHVRRTIIYYGIIALHGASLLSPTPVWMKNTPPCWLQALKHNLLWPVDSWELNLEHQLQVGSVAGVMSEYTVQNILGYWEKRLTDPCMAQTQAHWKHQARTDQSCQKTSEGIPASG